MGAGPQFQIQHGERKKDVREAEHGRSGVWSLPAAFATCVVGNPTSEHRATGGAYD